MSLNLYRRHRSRCKGNHEHNSQTGEYDEKKKGWKQCICPIFASGALPGNPKFRKCTECIEWDAARAAAARFQAEAEGQPTPPPPSDPGPPQPQQRTTVEDGVKQYLTNRQTRGVTDSTMAKYKGFTNRLRVFLDRKGIVFLDAVTVQVMDEFYAGWKDAPITKGKMLEQMKGFFQFCQKRKMLVEHPCDDLEPPVGYSVPKHKTPFTDEELERIFDAAERWDRLKWRQWGWRDGGGNPGKVTRDQIVCFILLMVETGLRISDMVVFDVPGRINYETGECFLFMHKTGKPLYTWINPDLLARLRELVSEFGAMPFDTPSKDMQHKTDVWRKRLEKIWEAAGPFKVKPTPHLFRHTFTRLQLQRGVTVEDVAELIGDTPEVVRKHYARWVPQRQARLTNILKEAYQEAKKSKWRKQVVAMPKKTG